MRRFLVLVMLGLLPLQISWATVADYCGHEQDKAAQHFGHHNDEHKASSNTLADTTEPDSGNPSSDPQQSTPNSDHDHSHLSSFLGVLSVYTFSMRARLQRALRCDDRSYSFLAADKPARPNWFVTA